MDPLAPPLLPQPEACRFLRMWAEARSLGQAALEHSGQEKGKDLQEKTPSWQEGVGLNRTSTDQSKERNMSGESGRTWGGGGDEVGREGQTEKTGLEDGGWFLPSKKS